MGEWVNCQYPSPSFFGGWAADMGLFIGPTPLMPTGVIDGLDPADFDEIDFVVGLPNPAHPGDPYYALDDSYDSPIWGTYRFAEDGPAEGSDTGWYLRSSGSAPTPAPTDVPPTGCHIWVVAYIGRNPFKVPTHPAAFYLPSTYAHSGRATLQTTPGHWSAYQPTTHHSRTQPRGGFGTDGGWGRQSNQTSDFPVTDAGQPLPLAEIAVAEVVSGPGDLISWPGEWLTTLGTHAGPLGLGFGAFSIGSVAAGQVWTAFVASGMVNPYPLGALVYEVDYGLQPYTDDTFEYAGPPVFDTFTGNLVGGTQTFYENRAETGADVDMTTSWRLIALTATPPFDNQVLVDGTTLANIPVGGPGTPTDRAPSIPYTVAIPAGTGSTLYLAAAPEILYTGVDGDLFPDIPMTGQYGIFSDWEWPDSVTFDYDTAPWRYWTHNPIVPAPPAATYLRMTQRDDGIGITGHPRLPAGNSPASRQNAHVPRVGDTNTYS